MEPNPNKKRKVAPVVLSHGLPLQIVNGNLVAGPARGGPRMVVPVSSVPTGAPIIRIPSSAVAALNRYFEFWTGNVTATDPRCVSCERTACSTNFSRGFQFVTAQSTSQIVPQLQQQQANHISQQHRQQLLQQQPPQLAPPLSSAPNPMMNQTMHQIRQQGIRTRGGAAPRPVYGTPRQAVPVSNTPRAVPPNLVRTPTTPAILRNATAPRLAPTSRVSSPHIRAQIRQQRP